jgi:catechol 2,3-dioxygenase-like lactoylglutathione lyase family enzyme
MLESFDFLYMPSRDVARDLAFYEDVLGAETVFAIERFGTRVAEVRLSGDGPRILLAEHIEGDAPVLLYRVAELAPAVAELEGRGLEFEMTFGFPYGDGALFHAPGGQRLAIYELTRPDRGDGIRGRLDFEPKRESVT